MIHQMMDQIDPQLNKILVVVVDGVFLTGGISQLQNGGKTVVVTQKGQDVGGVQVATTSDKSAPQQTTQLCEAEDALLHRVFQVGQTVSDVISRLHQITEWVSTPQVHVQMLVHVLHKGFLRQIVTRFFLQIAQIAVGFRFALISCTGVF